MKIRCVWEHNGGDTLLYAENCMGAFARGSSLEQALRKMPAEAEAWLKWRGKPAAGPFETEIVQEHRSQLAVADADSDVIFDEETTGLEMPEYLERKALALKSARDFLALYRAIPDKGKSCRPVRSTFYGQAPRTALEMYEHTKNVNDYYFGELGVSADHEGSIVECRERGFALLERRPDFLNAPARLGSYDEAWSLKKLLRRFVWHDRIHAKAMYRMAVNTFGAERIPNVFFFDG